MADRGTYRSVKTVLLDGPDFQKLSPEARWAFVALKLSIGPSGIEVHYREALIHEIAEKTGHLAGEGPSEALRRAFLELEKEDWVRWERNVIWLVGHLKHDPSINPGDQKHRKSIQRHISGLPRLAIVRQFINEHKDFFPEGDGDHTAGLPPVDQGPTEAHVRPSEGPSKAHRSSEDRRGKTEEGRPKEKTPREDFSESSSPDVENSGPEPPPGEPDPDKPDGSELPHPTSRMSASELIHTWSQILDDPLTPDERKRFKGVARGLTNKHSRADLIQALTGMTALFPHCPPKSEPWDLFDLQRKFTKAKAKARDHPEIKAMTAKAAFLQEVQT